jgi:AcrR family transcriptional regulator
MKSERRTQEERSAATRDALVSAARALFAQRGYADVGTTEIVRDAGLTRGALYHHFTDKAELFAATFEAVETETSQRIRDAVLASGPTDPVAALRAGAAAFFDVCTEPEMARIMLLEAPAVLGWARWNEISNRYNMGLVNDLLAGAIESGRIPPQPIEPLAHILIGALREAALFLVRADDRIAARAQVGAVMDSLMAAIASGHR